MAETIVDKVVGSAENIVNAVTDLKDSGLDKIKEKMEEINSSQEYITKGGFKLHEIEVSIGLPPEINGEFYFEKKISEKEREELLKETEDKTTVNLILKSLFKASDFYDSMKLGNYKLDVIILSLGLTPGIGVKFAKID